MTDRPRIRFINHAGYLLECGDVRLAVDPWIEGRAFNDCWSLLSPTEFTHSDFRDVTHLWFSHEHPDHFVPGDLKRIPEEHRRTITVLYQISRDHRVADWCRANGFGAVIELPAHAEVTLGPGFDVICGPELGGDSWLLARMPGLTVLNMNDCLVRERSRCERVRDLVGPIDVLLTQFSIASWDGNPDDLDRRRRGARQMLDQAALQTNVLKPRWVVPFASFVWFCHEDNRYMNEAANRVDVAEAVLREETEAEPVVLYPGDVWTPGEAHDSAAAVQRYLRDYERVDGAASVARRPTTEAQLREAAGKFQAMLTKPSGRLRLRLSLARQAAERRKREDTHRPLARIRRLLALATLRVDTARVHVHDLDKSYAFDTVHGLRAIEATPEECDIVTNADSLCYAFRMMWGGETLLIAGTFREVRPGSRERLFHAFDMAKGYSLGGRLRWRTVPLRMLQRLRPRGSKTG